MVRYFFKASFEQVSLTFLSLALVLYIFASIAAPSFPDTCSLALELDIVNRALDQEVEMDGHVAEQCHQE